MKADFVIIFITCPTGKEAKLIAVSLLKKRLIACAGIGSTIKSLFWWEGKITRSKEILLTIKTRRKNFKAVEKEVKRLHSYEVPEIIAVPVVCGSKEYLTWIKENTDFNQGP
jgi:periplasmic divalent cation tolerance protein